MPEVFRRRVLFLIDRIESSSYPVTETGYALVYRAFLRAGEVGDEVYVAYPDSPWTQTAGGEVRMHVHRVISFHAEPYRHYQSQRSAYRAGEHVGSRACHVELLAVSLPLDSLDAVVWRQESGEPRQAEALLRALQRVEAETVVFQSPRLALDPRFGSKVLPGLVDPRFTPRTHHTTSAETGRDLADVRGKAARIVAFVRGDLACPPTVIAKPLYGDNGMGIHVLGFDPRTRERITAVDDLEAWVALLDRYGELVVQEYVGSVRSPVGESPEVLAAVPLDRRDFGEIRFLLVDGELPRTADGEPCRVARRVPIPTSLIADSGISYATSLSDREIAFLNQLGGLYRRWGIHFGGGDLIRTADPERPFVFTDAAQSVCGHAVVTGALNGEPYMIVDMVLDSLERQIALRRSQTRSRTTTGISRVVRV